VLDALRVGSASFDELAMAVYGTPARGKDAAARNTWNKLKRLLARMESEGLICAEGEIWSLVARG
jgi:hypothetical protein